MKEWNEFLKKLNNYAPNTGTLKLISFIKKIKNEKPVNTLYRGDYWLQFSSSNFSLKFSPITKEIVIEEKNKLNNYTEEIIRTNYKIYFLDYIRIDEDKVINTYIDTNDSGSYLMLEASAMREDYSKEGFQLQKKCCIQCSSKFIFVSKDYRKLFELLVPDDYHQKGRDGKLDNDGIILQKSFYHYGLCGNNWEMNAAPNEKKDFVVFYATESNNYSNAMFFPAFFNETKNIIIEPFISDETLQFYGTTINGYEKNNISYEGHTIEDAKKYIQTRHFLKDTILNLEHKTALNKTLKKLRETK